MVAVPVQSGLILYVPVSPVSNPDDKGEPLITTKSCCVNFPFPSKLVIAIPFWGRTAPPPGRISPEMDWPYLPFSEAFEHDPACARAAPPSVKHATAAASIPLQNQAFMFCLLEDKFFWALGP